MAYQWSDMDSLIWIIITSSSRPLAVVLPWALGYTNMIVSMMK